MKKLLLSAAALILPACAANDMSATDAAMAQQRQQENSARMDEVLARQSDEVKARYQYRNPKETLEFFGIEPGMTVVEALPGGGWYSRILAGYLGPEGRLIGADYSMEMWPLFGAFADGPWIENRRTWAVDWVDTANEERGEDDAEISAFVFGSVPPEFENTADAVLLIRALHHFNRFEEEGGFFTAALEDIRTVLKPGGIVGVVQHRAPAGNSDAWAEGDNG